MKTTINERIRELVKLLGVSGSKFANMIGVPQTTISNILTRDTEPGYKILNAISNHIELLSTDWLLLGKGEMFATPYIEQPLESDSRNQFPNLKEALRQKEIDEMKLQMSQNQKLVSQLMKVIDNNTMIIKNLGEEIVALKTMIKMERKYRPMKHQDAMSYLANEVSMDADGFEEV